MPSLLILMPLLGLVILNLPLKDLMQKIAFWFALAIFGIQIMLALHHHPLFWNNELTKLDGFFKINFYLDNFGFIVLLCVGIVSIISLLVSRNTIHDEKERFKFINILIIASMGMSGIVIVRDIFSLYVFLEITAIASFVLIAFEKDIYGLEGAFKYLVLSAIATIMLLTSIALLFMVSGSTDFAVIHTVAASSHNNLIIFAIGLFLCGLLIKGGVVPFHAWVPDAYSSAPAAASVLLAGIVTKAAGVYTLIRVVIAVFGFDPAVKTVLLVLGTLSIVIGAFVALGQNDMKRMLSYSSVSQVGYIILGFGTGTFLGIAGAIFHLFNHSMFKSLLFVNASSVETRIGTTEMEKMGGLAARMPVTGTTSVIGMLSAAGVPPLAGFWSKLMIVIALWQTGYRGYCTVAIVTSVVTLAYLLVMQRKVFFGKLSKDNEHIEEARPGIITASVVLAVIIVSTGVFFPFIYNNFIVQLQELIVK